jgi:hypothetical protein
MSDQKPAEYVRSTHDVWRIWSAGFESIPCYCEATMDHQIGNEKLRSKENGRT